MIIPSILTSQVANIPQEREPGFFGEMADSRVGEEIYKRSLTRLGVPERKLNIVKLTIHEAKKITFLTWGMSMHPIAKRWRSSPVSHFLPKSGRLHMFCAFC